MSLQGVVAMALLAALCSYALQPATMMVLRRQGILDHPNHRSSHSSPVVRGGGYGVILGVALALGLGAVIYPSVQSMTTLVILVAGVIAGGVGARDDVRDLSPRVRLLVQVFVAWSIVLVLLDPADRLLVSVVAACLVVAYINAFNFMDGVNGISGSNGIVSGVWFVVIGYQLESGSILALGAALAGASIGFLPWNVPSARVFLGDVGSYAYGTFIGGAAVACYAAGAEPLVCLAPTLLYFLDTGTTLVRRLLKRAPLLEAHRDHLYQRLAQHRGHAWTAWVTATLSGLVCVAAYLGDSLSMLIPALSLPVILGAYVAYSGRVAVAGE